MTLKVQEYLKHKTYEDLENELGIISTKHDTLPLIILNYNQIESPKTNEIVRECRGLVLHTETNDVIAKSFTRFFNWGEVQEEMGDFDFSDFVVQSKEDGSIVLLYFFDGEWHANTRGSFAQDLMQFQKFTWRDAFCRALGVNTLYELKGQLDEEITYVCEFCSPWNKIIRKYSNPEMYLLSAFRGIEELSYDEVDEITHKMFIRPKRYHFSSIEEIQGFLREQESADPTFEGVVIRDIHNNRWKIKSATYLGLHKMRGEDGNLFNPKHLIPFILSGEEDELLTYFEEVSEAYFECKSIVLQAFSDTVCAWIDNKDVKSQKEFALNVQDVKFKSILFFLRGSNDHSSRKLKEIWRDSGDFIYKNLFKKKQTRYSLKQKAKEYKKLKLKEWRDKNEREQNTTNG